MADKKLKILMVEDEEELAEVFCLKLKEVGFNVDVAIDAMSGIQMINDKQYDLVLLDLVMPNVDGYEVLKKIRSNEKSKNSLIYIWSNLTQKDEIDKATKLGANGYLVKSDFTPSALAKKLREILNIQD